MPILPNRDTVLSMRTCLALFAAFAASCGFAASTADQPPHKVIVGTAMQAFWGEYPGLEKRLEQLSGLIDQMGQESHKKYGRGLDLVVLPEMAVTGEIAGDIVVRSVPLEGSLRETFWCKARGPS